MKVTLEVISKSKRSWASADTLAAPPDGTSCGGGRDGSESAAVGLLYWSCRNLMALPMIESPQLQVRIAQRLKFGGRGNRSRRRKSRGGLFYFVFVLT